MSFERQTANLLTIEEILSAPFVKLEGLESSYIVTPYGNSSRVNVMGTIVGIEDTGMILDDGKARIMLRLFEPVKSMPKIGELVVVIGKPRMHNSEKIIIPEIIKPQKNTSWITFRKHELSARVAIQNPLDVQLAKKETKEAQLPVKAVLEKKENSAEIIIRLIKENDAGKGVSLTELEAHNIDQFEKTITRLLEEGDIYEVRSGYVKVLD